MDTPTLILIYLGAALLGSMLPFLRTYFAHFHNLVNLVISACLEGGKIHLYRDGSGQTTGSAASPFKRALISYAGYTGASLVAIGLFYLVTRGDYHFVIYLYLGLSVVALLLWVRNAFGVVWGLSVTTLLTLPVYFRYVTVLPAYVNVEMILVHLSIFLASVLFMQSMISAFKVCRQAFMSRSNPKRKAALVQTKFVPAVILGLILFSQTLFAGYFFTLNFISLPFHFDLGMTTNLLTVKNQIWSALSGVFS
ncbi:M50 family metallopeptidase [Neobacillus drentensis]|uniref:M50 family metallopeptidase n=1 Tax=Neobacillus drentensis TaxID=220684 RepID=UPI001F46C1EA|nr:M50 family metallopeptidase [Neobacillus drentensis]ULT56601.1 M50 family metallopeptidase [Neobacillus drentensis]